MNKWTERCYRCSGKILLTSDDLSRNIRDTVDIKCGFCGAMHELGWKIEIKFTMKQGETK